MTSKQRYSGIQDVFRTMNDNACLFLCILSIAEEFNKAPVDLLEAYHAFISKGIMKSDFYFNDSEAALEYLTGVQWKREKMKVLPDPVPELMYTIEHWKNGKYEHFKRRSFDTLRNSITVQRGQLIEYYCYTARCAA